MKIKINEDTFDIVERIKEIDENYYVVYDTKNSRFEMHYEGIPQTFCFVIGEELDNRAIDKIYSTSVRFADNIIDEIDNNNKIIEDKNMQSIKSNADYMFREIYRYSSNSSRDIVDAFQTKWR